VAFEFVGEEWEGHKKVILYETKFMGIQLRVIVTPHCKFVCKGFKEALSSVICSCETLVYIRMASLQFHPQLESNN